MGLSFTVDYINYKLEFKKKEDFRVNNFHKNIK